MPPITDNQSAATAADVLRNDELARLRREVTQLRATLHDAETRLELASSPAESAGTWTYEVAEELLYGSAAFARLHGLSPKEVDAGIPLTRIDPAIHPDDGERIRVRARDLLKTPGPYHDEYRIVAHDGSIHWVVSKAHVETNAAGEAVRVVGMLYNITERRNAEENNRKQAEELRALMEAAPVALAVSYDPECRVIAGNAEAHRMLAVPAGNNLSATPPPGQEKTERTWYYGGVPVSGTELPMQVAARTGIPVVNAEMGCDTGDGRIRHFIANAIPLFHANGITRGALCAFLDITEWREAERGRRESDERFRLAAEAANGLVYEWRAETNRVWRSAGLYDMTGYAPEEAGDKPEWWGEVVHPDDMTRLWEVYNEVIARRDPHRVAEYRVRHKEGRWVHVMDRRHIEYGPDGEPVRMVGNVTDISANKAREQTLRESEVRYRTLTEGVAAIVWTTNTEGLFNRPIPGWEAFTGQPASAHVQSPDIFQMLHPDDQEEIARQWDIIRVEGRSFALPYRLWHQATQSHRHITCEGVPVRDDERITEWVGVIRDVHEKVTSREALKQRERELNAVNARLQRAMIETHHRIKNNLQVMSGMVELHTAAEGGLDAAGVQRVGQHIRTLAAIHDLLTGEANLGKDAAQLSAKTVLERLIPLLSETSGGRRFAVNFDDVRLPVREVAALALIVSEAVSNALKHSRGVIRIDFRVTPPVALIQICDDGDGFPDGFNPATHANTGIDLISHTAAHDLNGSLFCDNPAEGGARVTVTFPLP